MPSRWARIPLFPKRPPGCSKLVNVGAKATRGPAKMLATSTLYDADSKLASRQQQVISLFATLSQQTLGFVVGRLGQGWKVGCDRIDTLLSTELTLAIRMVSTSTSIPTAATNSGVNLQPAMPAQARPPIPLHSPRWKTTSVFLPWSVTRRIIHSNHSCVMGRMFASSKGNSTLESELPLPILPPLVQQSAFFHISKTNLYSR
jgi:hypothetical protein